MSLAIAYAMKKKKKCHGGEMMAEGGETSTSGNKTKTGGSNPGGASTGGAGTVTITTGKKPPRSINISDVGGRTDAHNAGGMDPGDEDDHMMAEGGEPGLHQDEMNPVAKGMKKAFKTPGYAEGGDVAFNRKEKASGYESHKKDLYPMKKMAEGGFIEEEKASGYEPMPHPCENCGHMNKIDSRMLNQHGSDEVGAEGMDEDNEPHMNRKVSHPVENQSEGEEEDMVGQIMKQRTKHYSKGGRVANDTPPIADSEEAQYDDLVKDDYLEFNYTGKNSGDEDGDKQEDEDRRDVVSQIMKSRKKKDRMPRPA